MKTITCQDKFPEHQFSTWKKTKEGYHIETLSKDCEIIKVKCVCGHCGEEIELDR